MLNESEPALPWESEERLEDWLKRRSVNHTTVEMDLAAMNGEKLKETRINYNCLNIH